MRILAIDMGDRRIGLAISDPTGTIASPAGHILRRPGKRLPVNAILERAKALEAEGFVVGLPLDQNGDETERSGEARRVAEWLGTRSGLTGRVGGERCPRAAGRRALRGWGGSARG